MGRVRAKKTNGTEAGRQACVLLGKRMDGGQGGLVPWVDWWGGVPSERTESDESEWGKEWLMDGRTSK